MLCSSLSYLVLTFSAAFMGSSPAAEPLRVRVEVITDRAKFENRLGASPRLVNFDDVETPQQGHTPFAADRYKAKGIIITGQDGQYVSRDFTYPANYKPVTAPNMYAPGPAVAGNAAKDAGGHETTVTFVDANGKPSAVAGFGCYFIDCNYPSLGPSSIEVFDVDGRSLGSKKGFDGNTGSQLYFGFLVSDEAGKPVPAIAKVKLVNGSGWPEVSSAEGVVLDDFLFTVPQSAVPVALTSGPNAAAPAGEKQPDRAMNPAEPKLWRWTEKPPPPGETARLKMPAWAQDRIELVALSPDGRTLATASKAGEYTVWNLSTGDTWTLPVKPPGANQAPRYLAFTSDNQTVLLESADGVALWDAFQKVQLATLQQEWIGLHSTDGQVVVVEVKNAPRGKEQVAVYELRTGKQLLVADVPATSRKRIVLSADGKTLAVLVADGVRLFDVPTGKERLPLRGIKTSASVLALSANGSLLVVDDARDHELLLWDVHDPAAVPKLTRRLGKDTANSATVLSSDGRTLAYPTGGQTVLYDIATARVTEAAVPKHRLPLVFPPKGAVLLAQNCIVDVGSGRLLTILDDLKADTGKMPVLEKVPALSDDGRVVAWVDRADGAAVVRPWVPDVGGAAGTLTASDTFRLTALYHFIQWSPDGKFAALLSTAGDCNNDSQGDLCMLDMTKRVQMFQRFYSTWGWGFPSKRQFVLNKRSMREQMALDLTTRKSSTIYRRDNDPQFHRYCVSPDGKTVVVSYWQPDKPGKPIEATVLTASGNLTKSTGHLLNSMVELLAFSPDGARLALADKTGKVWVFDLKTPKEMPTTAASATHGLLFREDGKALVCWDDKKLYTYDVDSGNLQEEYALKTGHAQRCNGAAVHPTKPLLVTCGENGEVLVKDLKTGAVKQRLSLGTNEVMVISFSPDGTLLLACSGKRSNSKDGTGHLWTVK
jgi:WD40 repeat protein